jgi:catechol 2,3-dioxygenase-like lactoylglutathione lyase family enzyme
VADFDATLERLRGLGSTPLTAPIGAAGARRVGVLDPDGVIVEIMEDRAPTPGAAPSNRPDAPAAARSITVSVADLDAARRYYVDALGMVPVADFALHTDEHEALWQLPGARADHLLLAGGDLWLELVHYVDPPGRPHPVDYRISDQGILNIAVAGRSVAAYERLRDGVLACGYGLHTPIVRERIRVHYADGPEGLSVEMSYFDTELDATHGFLPIAG